MIPDSQTYTSGKKEAQRYETNSWFILPRLAQTADALKKTAILVNWSEKDQASLKTAHSLYKKTRLESSASSLQSSWWEARGQILRFV